MERFVFRYCDHGLQTGYATNQSTKSGGRLHALVTQVLAGAFGTEGTATFSRQPKAAILRLRNC
jgi:hypothetical protein